MGLKGAWDGEFPKSLSHSPILVCELSLRSGPSAAERKAVLSALPSAGMQQTRVLSLYGDAKPLHDDLSAPIPAAVAESNVVNRLPRKVVRAVGAGHVGCERVSAASHAGSPTPSAHAAKMSRRRQG